MSTLWVFHNKKNKHTLYRGKEFLKRFCTSLRAQVTNVINFEKKKLSPLIKKELKLHQDVTECYICRKRFLKKFANDKYYGKVRHCCHFTGKYRGAVHNICNLRFKVLNEISAFFHKGRNYDYHLIIKERANKFEGQLGCPEKTQKTKKTKFIGIAKFMVSSL